MAFFISHEGFHCYDSVMIENIPYTLVTFLFFQAALLYLFCSAFFLIRKFDTLFYRRLTFLFILFFLWSSSALLLALSENSSRAFFWYDNIGLTWHLSLPVFFLFIRSLSGKSILPRSLRYSLFIPSIILIIGTKGSHRLILGFEKGILGWNIINNLSSIWYKISWIHCLLFLAASFFMLIQWTLKEKQTNTHAAASIVVVSFSITSFISFFFCAVFPPLFGMKIPPLMPIFMGAWFLFLFLLSKFYAIFPSPLLNHFSTIINDIGDALLILSEKGVVEYANASFYHLSLFSEQEILGKQMETIIPGFSDSHDEQSFLLSKHGHPVPVLVKREIFHGFASKGNGQVIILQDLRPGRDLAREMRLRKETARQLQNSEILFTKAFLLSPISMIIIDNTTHRVVEVNETFLSTFHYDRSFIESADTRSISFWLHQDDWNHIYPALMDNKKIRDYQTTLLDSKKDLHQVLLSAERFFITGRDCILYCMNDISDRYQLEQQLMRMQRMETLGFFAGSLAHDLNNIFTALGGNLELSKLQVSDQNKEAQESISAACSAYEKGRNLVLSMLQYARGRRNEKQSIDLISIIHDSEQLALHGSMVDLKLESHNRIIPPLQGYPDLLMQLFMNLFINARQAIDGSGTVFVDLYLQREQIVVDIRDTGPGIPQEHAKAIFQKAFSTKTEGTGLGLAIVSHITELHGGSIVLEPHSGKVSGARFVLRLPLP